MNVHLFTISVTDGKYQCFQEDSQIKEQYLDNIEELCCH